MHPDPTNSLVHVEIQLIAAWLQFGGAGGIFSFIFIEKSFISSGTSSLFYFEYAVSVAWSTLQVQYAAGVWSSAARLVLNCVSAGDSVDFVCVAMYT